MSNPSVLAATIALAGVIISVLTSLLISFISTRSEIRKLKTSLRNQYAEIILEKRLNAYASCYYILSNFAKKIWRSSNLNEKTPCVSYLEVEKFNEAISEWDSNNALLLSPRAVGFMIDIRIKLEYLIVNGNTKTPTPCLIDNNIDVLFGKIGNLEMSLKNDIGIFDVEQHESREYIMSSEDFSKKYLHQGN